MPKGLVFSRLTNRKYPLISIKHKLDLQQREVFSQPNLDDINLSLLAILKLDVIV